ncbi:MAG: excinuclease ABC subunit UvrA [Hydrotalea sp.]|nr:excinuclease ABC subunit UvrA [Hydrotalea sp.]
MASRKKNQQDNNEFELANNADVIEVIGAREHNLKNIDLQIPKNSLVVFTGVSGSGKSSLAFDTIYHEGQRRYMESFSAYARQFIGDMERPDVDKISGLSPVISIEQKTTNKNPRSTVGTVTEVYDFLRLLYARIGEAYSYNTGKKMVKFSEEEIVDNIFKRFKGQKIILLAPLIRGRKGHYRELFEEIRKKGFLKVRVDGEIKDLTAKMQVDRFKIHDIEVVVDRLAVEDSDRLRISQSVQQALKLGKDLMFIVVHGKPADSPVDAVYSRQLMCEDTGLSYEEPSPNTFSFNSPYGACPHCKGLGTVYQVDMSAIVPDDTISIKKGGIAPLGEEREAQIYQHAAKVCKKYKVKTDTAIKDLPKDLYNLLLFGLTSGPVSNSLLMQDDGELFEENVGEFEGVIPMMKRWFLGSGSTETMREWVEKFLQLSDCYACDGTRLKKESRWFKILDQPITELSNWDLNQLHNWIITVHKELTEKQQAIAKDVLKEIQERLEFLLHVGLHYLSLNRPSRTLSGGESQRIRLATQIGSQLQGITYILDEPSIGLHQRDNHQLIEALKNLRDIGNSVLVVEHDKDIMLAADYLIDIGPKAGKHGGKIVAQGHPKDVLKSGSETADYLLGKKKIAIPTERRVGNGKHIVLKGAVGHNLKKINVSFPLGKLIVVSGVSGSGKSTLINETLYPLLASHCYGSRTSPMPFASVKGLEHVDKVIEIDQTPIGRTPRSNPATYCGFFTEIRSLYAQVPEAKIRGYQAGRFSFNVKGGRCEVCEGGGMRVIEMNFLPDVYVPCEKCNGKRYNRETLEIRYKGKSISDVLNMTVDEACEFFQPVPFLYRKIKVLQDVGLGYITLGQSAVTLSGGEAQRVKLSTELGKKDTGKTFYILDEPTTGLHFQDIRLLMDVVHKLVDRGNTVLIIEHNLDVIKLADHIIDLGPEGGAGGGEILFEGTPEEMIANIGKSHTAKFLKIEMEG